MYCCQPWKKVIERIIPMLRNAVRMLRSTYVQYTFFFLQNKDKAEKLIAEQKQIYNKKLLSKKSII